MQADCARRQAAQVARRIVAGSIIGKFNERRDCSSPVFSGAQSGCKRVHARSSAFKQPACLGNAMPGSPDIVIDIATSKRKTVLVTASPHVRYRSEYAS
jgi:hypothetical protein